MPVTNKNSGFGLSQSWQNVVGSRALGTLYTNTTPNPIQVSVSLNSAFTGGSAGATVEVGGVIVAVITTNESNGSGYSGHGSPVSFVVPPQTTYRVNQTAGSSVINGWAELR